MKRGCCMEKICAVIVTYNRPELLCRCVEHLLKQTYPLDILIYDNHSSMDTKRALEEREFLNDHVTYYYAEKNTGGSGGFHNGMKMAVEKGYEYLWLMDDDGYAVEDTTLERIMEAKELIKDELFILNSLVICDEETLQLSFSVDRSFDGKYVQSLAQDGLYKGAANPFNGTLIPTKLIDKIGYTKKEFFVYGDETEYTLRSKANGAELYTVVNSLYYHPTYIAKKKKFFGKEIVVSQIPLWKAYCMARNTTYYTRLYFGIKERVVKTASLILGALYVEKNKWARLKITLRGIKDGKKGDFSRELDLTK